MRNRKQLTGVNNVKSSKITNGYVVPQESIRGAWLFIIYNNVLQKCEIVLYADDIYNGLDQTLI